MKPMSLLDEPAIKELLRVVKFAPVGDFVEIGVFKGGSAYYLNEVCKEMKCTLHLFDTFEGMPFRGHLDIHPVGMFGNVDFEFIKKQFPDAKIYKGIFPATLPEDLKNVSFVHVDCDQYESVKSVIEIMPERMVDGGLMYFDDYSNIPGAKKAIEDNLDDFRIIGHRALWQKGA